MRSFRKFLLTVCGLVALLAPGAARGSSDAILCLLNSRSACSPRAYEQAAENVAKEAKDGRLIQQFVLGLVSRERTPPAAARLDAATRHQYVDENREAIRRIADTKGNAMALYLLSLDSGDTNQLHRAAQAGNVQALNAWGSHLVSQVMANRVATSNEIERALSAAYGHFRRAAGRGDASGLFNLGTCLWRGLGVKRDDRLAFNCFRAAAEQGHPEAMNNIGAFFREGTIVGRDLQLAAKWFAKSASYDNPFGQFNYALALRRGEGLEKDDKAAARHLEKAVAGGCVEAMDVLGVVYWKGEGVTADARRAVQLFRQAAQVGYPPAMENLSTCFERGTGVEQSDRQAVLWKIRSRAARGDRAARQWLRANDR